MNNASHPRKSIQICFILALKYFKIIIYYIQTASKARTNKMINGKIITSNKALLPLVSLNNFTSARASFYLKDHESQLKSTHTKLFPFFFKKVPHTIFLIKKQKAHTHTLMKNCLSPFLVNEERPE